MQLDAASASGLPQSFFAGFTLHGSAEQGGLSLQGPLGSTLAQLAWSNAGASLTASGKTQQFASLDAMAVQATGMPLPIAALFHWLAGQQTSASGWSADLSQLAQGRLLARRHDAPQAVLRLVLEPSL